jgi:nuclear pore complex protein Nup188
MAPISDSCYFPSLDKCLQGDDLLTSWRSAFHAVLDTEDSLAIRKFFSDPVVEDFLLHPLNAFPPPSQESRSAFGTKTSAINVTPLPTSRFNINELKEDALWLSTEAKIDEISALRVVVLEWQSRAWAALVGPLSKQELLGIQESGGQGLMSVPGALLSEGLDADEIQAEFETKESRRSRLLRIYLSERQFLLKCVNYLLQSYLYQELSTDSTIQSQKPEAQPASFQVLGENLVRIIRESDSLFLACVDAIKSNIGKLLAGSSWFKEIGGRPDVEMEWVRTNIAEATTLMEIIFQILDISEDLPSSQAVLSWLEITSIYGFFNFHFVSTHAFELVRHGYLQMRLG